VPQKRKPTMMEELQAKLAAKKSEAWMVKSNGFWNNEKKQSAICNG
jgi:hypothetical protein